MTKVINKIYCMDNLKLMKKINDNSIDLIYCDILYNTGNKFDDFDDDLGSQQQAIEWYKPRLKEMKRILKDTGSIYIHCDHRLVYHLKVEMDNIFGVDNFRNDIIWHYSKMNCTKNKFIQNHDIILFYTKSDNYTFNPQYNDKESALKTRLKKFIDNDDKVLFKYVKTHKSQLMDNYIKSAKKKYNKDILDDNDIVIDFSEKSKQKVDTVWDIPIIKGNSNEWVDYNTQKPIALLERIIKASSNKGDVVADFFIGSGTTMTVAKMLGRNYIGCDINPKAIKITNERLKEVND